jgi:hypothetical protein
MLPFFFIKTILKGIPSLQNKGESLEVYFFLFFS